MSEPSTGHEWQLHRVTLDLCEGCISGQGGQCHTPGCILWIHDVDAIPLDRDRITFRGCTPSEDYITGYLAALGNVEHAIRSGEAPSIAAVKDWIADDSEGMAK